MRATSVLRHSPWDGTLVALTLVHAALLLTVPSVPLIAVGLWWNANTVAHNFIHLPFFRSRRLNDAFAIVLTLILGFPQSLWRARHLAHHAGRDGRVTWTGRMTVETLLVAALWATIALISPRFYLLTYLPGFLIGLGLCQLQGHFEHARGTTSHYGRIYNWLFFRDGLHVEHHAKPSTHWSRLRPSAFGEARSPHSSVWPPVLRWLDATPATLDALERLVLRSSVLQSWVLGAHASAISRLLIGLPDIKTATVIGGGLFPRTAIVLRRLLPDAAITIVDRDPRHLESARVFLGNTVTVREAECDAATAFDADLVVVPLAFVGDREAFYRHPPASIVLVHDWIWRRRGEGCRVSWWLAKRINVVRSSAKAIVTGRAA